MKKPLQRSAPDVSQRIRKCVQWALLALNVWIGVEFYLFVRHYETAGATVRVSRPPGVEGWLPIASLMNLKYLLWTGDVPSTHSAGMFLLIAFLAISFLLRKAFCGWLCPVGTVSEWLWKAGRSIFRRSFHPWKWLDIPLRSLKYVLLALFLWAVGSMSPTAIRAFLEGPYGVVADVKMLDFFRYLSTTAAVIIGVVAILSIFVENFWCRYLCPYGALMGLAALLSPLRIRREPDRCIDCAKCAQACPSMLPVDRLITIRSAECIGCYQCIAECPAEGALWMATPGRRRLPAWAMAVVMAVVFVGVCAWARWTGHWHTHVPDWVYSRLIPKAREFSHP